MKGNKKLKRLARERAARNNEHYSDSLRHLRAKQGGASLALAKLRPDAEPESSSDLIGSLPPTLQPEGGQRVMLALLGIHEITNRVTQWMNSTASAIVNSPVTHQKLEQFQGYLNRLNAEDGPMQKLQKHFDRMNAAVNGPVGKLPRAPAATFRDAQKLAAPDET